MVYHVQNHPVQFHLHSAAGVVGAWHAKPVHPPEEAQEIDLARSVSATKCLNFWRSGGTEDESKSQHEF